MPIKGNWPHHTFTKWEKVYIARRVIEHAGALTPQTFYSSDEIAYGYPRRPGSDMPIHYMTSYLDDFASFIIGIGLKEHRAGLREAILTRLNEPD